MGRTVYFPVEIKISKHYESSPPEGIQGVPLTILKHNRKNRTTVYAFNVIFRDCFRDNLNGITYNLASKKKKKQNPLIMFLIGI